MYENLRKLANTKVNRFQLGGSLSGGNQMKPVKGQTRVDPYTGMTQVWNGFTWENDFSQKELGERNAKISTPEIENPLQLQSGLDLAAQGISPELAMTQRLTSVVQLMPSQASGAQALETPEPDDAPTDKSVVKKQIGEAALKGVLQGTGALGGILGGDQGAQGMQAIGNSIMDAVQNGVSGGGAAGAIGGAMMTMSGMIDRQMFGDKNFGLTSAKIDSAVHGVSGAIAGIVPWGTLAAGVLESLNVATKAGGNTVQGYDVNIASSGYSQAMAHMEDSSSRGLFGIDFGNTQEKLDKRNRDLKMAMTAAQVAETNAFEQEARADSIDNTLLNNKIALSGGLNTDTIAG